LGIDGADVQRQLREALDALSKYTHVTESTFGEAPAVVDARVDETLSSLLAFLELIEFLREQVANHLREVIDREAVNTAIAETIGEIDELATHHYIDEVAVEDVEVRAIDEIALHLTATGTIYAELQWGSGSDMRNDNGVAMPAKFAFSCDLQAPVSLPLDVTADPGSLQVDTSGWGLAGNQEDE
jgi:hypothetical protein